MKAKKEKKDVNKAMQRGGGDTGGSGLKLGIEPYYKHLFLVSLVISAVVMLTAVASAATIYVPDDQGTIQSAVNAANPGDTIIVRDGTYNENVDVDVAHLTIRSENGSANCIVNASNPSDDVVMVRSDHVKISGFTVKGATSGMEYASGIHLYHVNYCNISCNNASNNRYGICLFGKVSDEGHNVITNNLANSNGKAGICLWGGDNNELTNNTANLNNDYGIYLRGDSDDNTLLNNTANSNDDEGIYLDYSDDNTLTNNIVNSNDGGITLHDSNDNTLQNNSMSGNNNNFGVHGRMVSEFTHNINTNNKVNGKPIYYWINEQDKVFPNEAGYVGVVDSTNITVRDSTLTNNCQGVLFAFTDNSTIENVTILDNYYGIYLYSSHNNTLTNNTANSNDYCGILLDYSNSNNTLTNNTVNENDGFGIYLYYSDSNTFSNNTVNSNNNHGIFTHDSDNNLIYNNYFENTINAWDSNGHNQWNVTKTPGMNIIGGPYLGGNYWSDYDGEDSNSDGLGDTLLPYNCSENITFGGDWHPLVQVGAAPPNITSFAPPSPVNDTVCTWRTFNVTVNQTVNVSWYLNGTAQVPKNVSVTEANFTFHAQYVGVHNVSAVAENANGSDMQKWDWNVTAPLELNCTCGGICVNTTGWWRDGADFNASGTPIQHAIDNATTGDTICVKDGTYNENVVVTKSHLTIRSENGSSVTTVSASLNPDEHVFNITDQTNVTLQGFEIRDARGTSQHVAGIYMDNASDCNSSNNFVTNISAPGNNACGIWLNNSNNNSFNSNTFISNINATDYAYGILLDDSANNSFSSSTNVSYINASGWDGYAYGIMLNYSANNSFSSSTSVSYVNAPEWEARGIMLNYSNNNSFSSSTNVSYIDATLAWGISLEGSNNTRFSSNTTVSHIDSSALGGFAYGISLDFSNNNSFNSSTSVSYLDAVMAYGIALSYSTNNSFSSSTNVSYIDALIAYGILLGGSTNNSFSSSTEVSYIDTVWDAYGIYLEGSTNNTFSSSTSVSFINSTDLNAYGISLWWDSNNNSFSSSTNVSNIDACEEACGIMLWDSNNDNSFSSSTSVSFVNATDATLGEAYGIRLDGSNNTLFNTGSISHVHAATWYNFYSDENSHGNEVKDCTLSSYPTTVSFTYDNGIGLKSVDTPPADPAGKQNISKYVNATNVTAPSWIFMNVSYEDADIIGVDEASLKMYRHNGTGWELADGSGINGVNQAANYVYANITEFSMFAPLGNVTALSPILCTAPDPPSHDFGIVPPGQTRNWDFEIANCGDPGSTLIWNVVASEPWISVSPSSGTNTIVTVTIDKTKLPDGGVKTGTITVNSNGGTKTGVIRVNIELETAPETGYATFATTDGYFDSVEAVAEKTLPAEGKPADMVFPYGFFSFTIEGLTAGQSVTVNIVLPSDMPAGAEYWKYGPTLKNPTPHWYEFMYDGQTGAEINGNLVTLHFVDGQRGDDNPTPDGKIIDQGAPGSPPIPVPEFNPIGLLAFIGVSSVVLAFAMVRKRKE